MSIKYKKLSAYLIIPALCFFLLFIPKKTLSHFKLGVSNVVSIPVRLINFTLKELKKILYYHRTFEEYKRLRREVSFLKTRLVGLEEVIRENTRFQKLLDFKRSLIFSSVLSNVIGRDPANWNASVIVDKGIKDGISEGMPVVNALGVVGKVAEINNSSSRIILVNDPQFSVAALVQRTRENGLLSGALQGNCRLRYLTSDVDVKIGDKVITSKLSPSFPERLLIGEITDIIKSRREDEIEYVVEPSVELSRIEELLIIQK